MQHPYCSQPCTSFKCPKQTKSQSAEVKTVRVWYSTWRSSEGPAVSVIRYDCLLTGGQDLSLIAECCCLRWGSVPGAFYKSLRALIVAGNRLKLTCQIAVWVWDLPWFHFVFFNLDCRSLLQIDMYDMLGGWKDCQAFFDGQKMLTARRMCKLLCKLQRFRVVLRDLLKRRTGRPSLMSISFTLCLNFCCWRQCVSVPTAHIRCFCVWILMYTPDFCRR